MTDTVQTILEKLDTAEIIRLRALAKERGSKRKDQNHKSIPVISREAPLALSFAQQRLWFLAQLEGVSATYHIPLALRLRGPLDLNAWRRSLDQLFARHEA